MPVKAIACILAITYSIVLSNTLFSHNVVAQSQTSEKSKREKFGSSLEKLKTDPSRKDKVTPKTNNDVPTLDEGDIVRINTMLVVFDLLVFNQQGKIVSGLTKNDFILTQAGTNLPVTTFALGSDVNRRRSIILIIDHSPSQRPYIDTSVESAKILVQSLGPLDEMALVADDVKLVMDFTSDRSRLTSALDSLKKKSSTGAHQYSALMATLHELVKPDERTIIIFQTDGDQLQLLQSSEPNSFPANAPRSTAQFSLRDVYLDAERSQATVYSVISGFRLIGLSVEEQLAQLKRDCEAKISTTPPGEGPIGFWKSVLARNISDPSVPALIKGPLNVQLALAGIAKVTGGQTEFLEDPSQANDIYRRILDDTRQRYLLGFQPPDDGSDTKRRTVKIEVRGHPEYSVLGRKSYYSSGARVK